MRKDGTTHVPQIAHPDIGCKRCGSLVVLDPDGGGSDIDDKRWSGVCRNCELVYILQCYDQHD